MSRLLPVLPTVNVLEIGALKLDEWNHTDSIYPCWRLYWNADEGAWIECEGRHPIEPGCLVLVPPFARVDLRLQGSVRHFYVCFEASQPFAYARRQIYSCNLECRQLKTAEKLYSEASRGNRVAPLDLLQIIAEALSAVPKDAWTDQLGDVRVQSSLAEIEKRLNDPPSNAELAKPLNLATNSFVRLFRREMGTTPHRYILLRRLTCASQMLRSGASIEESSDAYGFCDRYYFSRMFAEVFGVSPGRYRQGR